MKKFFILPFVLFFSFSALAQVSPQIGFRLGVNSSDFYSLKNSSLKDHSKQSFTMAGVYANVVIKKKLGIRAEVLSNGKGASVNYTDSSGVNYQAVRKLNYTDFTLSLLYQFKIIKVLDLYISAGYSFESLNKAENAIKSPFTKTEDYLKYYETNANSMLFSAGFNIKIKRLRIQPELRYTQGLTDIVKGNVQTKNTMLTGSVGIALSLF